MDAESNYDDVSDHENIGGDSEYESDNLESENEIDGDDQVPDNPYKEAIGKYLLYLRSSTRATNKDVINILHEMQEVVQSYVVNCLNDVHIKLQERTGLNLMEHINVNEIKNNIDCTQGLNTIRRQDLYFKKKYNFMKPHRITLGERFVPYGTASVDGNQPVRIKRDEFIHIPISEVLPKWLENPTFQNVTKPKIRREDNVLETYMDGYHFQNLSFILQKPNCRFIKLYYDEVDMCDAVGSI